MLMSVALCWALILGLLSTRDADLRPVLFHLAVWVPVLAILWRVGRRNVEASWRLMALGLVLFGLGDMAWDLIVAAGLTPDASWADLVYLAGYVFLTSGIVVLLRTHGGPDQRDGLIDGVLLAVPAALLIIEFLVVPADDGTQDLIVRVVTAAYPLADTLLVAGLVWLLVTPGLSRRVIVPLALGMAATLVLDVVWAAGSLAGATNVTDVVDGLYPLSYVVLACGIALGACTPVAWTGSDRRTSVPWGRVVLLGAGLVAAPLVGVLGVIFNQRLQPVLVVCATIVAATLVILRFVRLINDLNRTTEELTSARNEIMEQAVRDPLTGVFNRLILPEQLAVLASGTGPPAALLSIDLDRFKQVNDDHGHQAGDAVLETVAARLRTSTRSQDAVIRMGGDEFLIVLWDVGPAEATELATRIVTAIEEPVRYGDGELRVSASVGIAVVGTGPTLTDTDELLHRADVAMYEAKRTGAGVVHVALS